MTSRQTIHRSIVGSHMWGMEHALSDTDIYEIYVAPTKDILRGTADTKNIFDQSTPNIDITAHELGQFINLILEGNINAIKGILSPVVRNTTPFAQELAGLVRGYPSKASYKSIHGIAKGNFRKYIANNKDPSPERCLKVARDAEWGIKWLRTGIADFAIDKTRVWSPRDVERVVEDMDLALKESTLIDRPPEDIFRNFVLHVRMVELDGDLPTC